jgi:osmoprotectant transport system ATP-binding protein
MACSPGITEANIDANGQSTDESSRDRIHGSAVQFRGASKLFPGNDVPSVDDVTMDVAPGELVVLLGTSGSGKTTLLKMVNRLVEPTSGTILVNGENVQSLPAPTLRRQIGYVIQQAGLFPHMRVRDNVAVVPRLLKWDKPLIEVRVTQLLDLVGLPDDTFGDRYPAQLSGGEQQRVGLARALAAEPPTLLMDEPFGALDAITRRRLQDELRRVHRILKPTILFVTHDVDEAVRLADRIAVMRAGRLLQVGTPLELILHPADDFVSDLVGANDAIRRMRLIPVRAAMLPGSTGPANGEPRLEAGATLHEAFNLLLLENHDSLAVTDDTGRVQGMVTMTSLREAVNGHPADPAAEPLTAD